MGNALSLCKVHHNFLHHKRKITLKDIEKAMGNIFQKEIEWQDSRIIECKVIVLKDKFLPDGSNVKIVVQPDHFRKIQELIEYKKNH